MAVNKLSNRLQEKVGLLINFGHSVQIKIKIYTENKRYNGMKE